MIGCYSEWLRSCSPGRLQGEAVRGKWRRWPCSSSSKAVRIVVVTLDLLTSTDTDPVAALMQHDLIGYCLSGVAPATALPCPPTAQQLVDNEALRFSVHRRCVRCCERARVHLVWCRRNPLRHLWQRRAEDRATITTSSSSVTSAQLIANVRS